MATWLVEHVSQERTIPGSKDAHSSQGVLSWLYLAKVKNILRCEGSHLRQRRAHLRQIPVQAWICRHSPLEPSAFCLLPHMAYNSLISLGTGHTFIPLQRRHQCETRQAFLEWILLVAITPSPSFPTAFRSMLWQVPFRSHETMGERTQQIPEASFSHISYISIPVCLLPV